MQNIRILEGTYKIRGKDVDLSGMVFPLVEEFKVGAKGGYVTVDGKAVAGHRGHWDMAARVHTGQGSLCAERRGRSR